MIITLSPSKGQDFETPALTKKYSRPADLMASGLLIKELRKIKAEQLRELMDVSSNIAELNGPSPHPSSGRASRVFK